MVESGYKYDVAFSCLARGEPLARAISDLLAGRLTTFLYSDQQKEIAAKDGIDVFSGVFKRDARIVVILYRSGWGDTKWTRIEQTAIKDRGLDTGFGFVFMIPLDKPPTAPVWYPNARLWFDADQWGAKGTAAAIEQRVREAGGTPHEETAEQNVARLRLERAANAERERALNEFGAQWADEEVESLFKRLEAVASSSGGELEALRLGHAFILRGGPSVQLNWEKLYSNLLVNATLTVALWDKPRSFKPQVFTRGEPRQITSRTFTFGLSEGARVWAETGTKRQFPTMKLADECVRMLTDASRKTLKF